MGMYGTTMTALFSVKRRLLEVEVPVGDLTRITTPPTPSDQFQCISVQVDIRTPPFSEEESEGEEGSE